MNTLKTGIKNTTICLSLVSLSLLATLTWCKEIPTVNWVEQTELNDEKRPDEYGPNDEKIQVIPDDWSKESEEDKKIRLEQEEALREQAERDRQIAQEQKNQESVQIVDFSDEELNTVKQNNNRAWFDEVVSTYMGLFSNDPTPRKTVNHLYIGLEKVTNDGVKSSRSYLAKQHKVVKYAVSHKTPLYRRLTERLKYCNENDIEAFGSYNKNVGKLTDDQANIMFVIEMTSKKLGIAKKEKYKR